MSNDILIGIGSRNGTEPEVETLSGTDLTVNVGTLVDSYKYVIHHTNNKMLMYRHGELWRDETGDSVILGLVTALAERDDRIHRAVNCLVCAAISPMDEIIENTMNILGGDDATSE